MYTFLVNAHNKYIHICVLLEENQTKHLSRIQNDKTTGDWARLIFFKKRSTLSNALTNCGRFCPICMEVEARICANMHGILFLALMGGLCVDFCALGRRATVWKKASEGRQRTLGQRPRDKHTNVILYLCHSYSILLSKKRIFWLEWLGPVWHKRRGICHFPLYFHWVCMAQIPSLHNVTLF